MALGFMLAASSAWYLPALFLGCFSWVFAPFLHSSLLSRPFVRIAYRWFPPLLVAGLLVSRALDLVGLEPNHPRGLFSLTVQLLLSCGVLLYLALPR